MKIGDRAFVHGYVDEIRKDTVIIRNKGGYFGTDKSEVITGEPRTVNCSEFPTGWIPCSERLPKTDLRVLITAWGDTDIAWIDEYGLWQTEDYTFHDKEDVTAWMYLPDPYKGGEEE